MVRLPLLLLVVALTGCEVRRTADAPVAAEPAFDPGAAAPADASFLQHRLWDDGKAEVALYLARRTQDVYGRYLPQQFVVGTYVVKHTYSPQREAKADASASDAVPAFKHALFYEFETTPGDGRGAYQYKRAFVTNTAVRDGRTLKTSRTTFDWCSNAYEDYSFAMDGTTTHLLRSDDYGNSTRTFDAPANAYPPAAVPFLIRSLDFRADTVQAFRVLLPDGQHVGATATRLNQSVFTLGDSTLTAEVVRVRYDAAVPSIIGERTDEVETYWRSTGPERLLLQLEGASGRYRLTLTNHARAAYWSESVFAQAGWPPFWP